MSLPTKDQVDTAYLVKHDGLAVWIRDDYLASRFMYCKGDLKDLLDHVAEVKQHARHNGVRFSA